MTHNRRTGEYSYGRNAEELAARERPVPPMQYRQGGEREIQRPIAGRENVAGDGVQEHSKGEIYPAVIRVVERYAIGSDSSYGTLAERLRSVSYVLMLDGHEEEYACREDAEQVARALLASPFLRGRWSSGEEFGPDYSAAEDAEAYRTGGRVL